MVYEYKGEWIQRYNILYFITEMDQSKTTNNHMFNVSFKMTANCQTVNWFAMTKYH